jgi:hypothetical protein
MLPWHEPEKSADEVKWRRGDTNKEREGSLFSAFHHPDHVSPGRIYYKTPLGGG